ncbi:nucleoside phosphorylase domain-containing protein [Daldinia eschscholtzii]|nr:nucleoside phosphorylase domain-containing protein [Daldinia eschscholtzii]
MPQSHEYTIGWICAVQDEFMAACRMLDQEISGPKAIHEKENNAYVLGRIHDHYVVIGCLPAGIYGISSATAVAKDMIRAFPSIRFALMVGIGGGAPTPERDIRLGDVVVSQPHGTLGGVVQFDLGKRLPGGQFQRTGHLNAPPTELLGVLQEMERQYNDPRSPDRIAENMKRMDDLPLFRRPKKDRLFPATYKHPGGTSCDTTCEGKELRRPPRATKRATTVHYGIIASSNSVVKDAGIRDKLARDPSLNVLCFEMEAAGLMNDVPCLVVRGICDYSDSHKNDDWQKYAALVAAAYARELLRIVRPSGVTRMRNWTGRL